MDTVTTAIYVSGIPEFGIGEVQSAKTLAELLINTN
jgi:hypothetical protein